MTASSDDNARRAFWTRSLEAANEFIAAAARFPVAECGERMISMREAVNRAGVEVVFAANRLTEIHEHIFFLREGLVPALLAVAEDLNRRGWVLKVEDGYRTCAMQRDLSLSPRVFDKVLQRTMWELEGRLPSRELLLKRLAGLCAQCPKVGTHMSGSAIDITVLQRDTGQEVDRGGPYVELSELTPMESPFVSVEAQRNRQEISGLMAKHGFVAYPFEFWHYSQGDVYDQLLARASRPARYGPVNLDIATGAVSPIEDPLRPLNSLDAIQAEMDWALKRLAQQNK